MDKNNRRKCLIFKEVKVREGRTAVREIKHLWEKVLGIDEPVSIGGAHKLGNPLQQEQPLKVEFLASSQMDQIFKYLNYLKGIGIVIQKVRPKEIRDKENRLLAIRKEIQKKFTARENNRTV